MIPVRFADAKEFLVEYTSNISLGGVFVRTANPAAFGTVVRLSLELPGTSQAVPVTGQVAFVLPADQAARQGKVPGMGVRFARLDPAVQETLAAYVEGQQRKSRGRVLLVDDDAVVSQKLADLLRSHHLNVTTVSSAIKALEILRFGGVDFICSDIVMPRMDGFEFRDNLRNNPKTANIPFIFLTSSENAADMQLAAELGVQFFLRKPVEPGALLALLRQVLGDAAFTPQAPGATPPPSEEKVKRKQTQDRRIVEIAYRKFVALGMDTRFTADESGVYGQLQLKTVNIQDPATGNRLERAGLYSVGHDRVKPFWPRALGALPMFAFLDIPDAPALEKVLATAFARRIDAVRQIKQTLDSYKIPNRYDAAGMRMLGQVKSGTDSIVFSVRDSKTLLLESINGRSFGEVAQMRARLVDVSESKGGSDVEIALETAFRRLQQSMQQEANASPATATVIGADGRRSAVVATDLSVDPDAPPPAAKGGQWIGEPEVDQAAPRGTLADSDGQQMAAAAIDIATKAAIAATVGAAIAAANPEPEPEAVGELATADLIIPPTDEMSVPELATGDLAIPRTGEILFPEGAAAKPAPADPEAAEVDPVALAVTGEIAMPEAVAAADRLDVDSSAPEATVAPPPPADDVWPDSAAPAEAGAFASASSTADDAPVATSPFGEPVVAAESAGSIDDWSAYATPEASDDEAAETAPAEAEPPELTDHETAADVRPESLETAPDRAAFAGAEYELGAEANGNGAAPELELAAPEPVVSAPEEAWSARDAEAPMDSSPAPEMDPITSRPDAPVPVQTDFSSLNDMESTVVPRSEPPPEENLTPEEKQARDWADEWTGDVATAEPLWTIQPGEDAIKSSPTVADALDTPAPDSAAAPPPGAPSASGAGMTAMVCTLCASTYAIGDEIDDERLLLVCPSCIAKNLA